MLQQLPRKHLCHIKYENKLRETSINCHICIKLATIKRILYMGDQTTYELVLAGNILRIVVSYTSELQTHMDELQQQHDYVLLFDKLGAAHYTAHYTTASYTAAHYTLLWTLYNIHSTAAYHRWFIGTWHHDKAKRHVPYAQVVHGSRPTPRDMYLTLKKHMTARQSQDTCTLRSRGTWHQNKAKRHVPYTHGRWQLAANPQTGVFDLNIWRMKVSMIAIIAVNSNI